MPADAYPNQDPQTPSRPAPAAQATLELFGSLLSHTGTRSAAAGLVREIAARFSFDAVSIGLLPGPRSLHVELIATSRGAAGGPPGAAPEHLTAAMAEALDQRASLVWPEVRSHAQPRITVAHRRLAQAHAGSVLTVPLVADGQAIGALCAERSAGRPMTVPDLETLEHIACLCARVIGLMRHNERPLHQRAKEALTGWRSALLGPERAGRRYLLLGALLLLGGLALVPAPFTIGGAARLEGAVQRVLAAPADGFLHKVHARPGDTVRAGQPLVELATQDLQLEARRWESQIAQHQNAYAAAGARADRAQWAIGQAKAAEAEGQLALVNVKLERSSIQAPFDGVLVRGDLSQSLGAPVLQGAELMTIVPRGRYRVIVEVDERDIAPLKAGQSGSLALSAMPWDTLPIRLQRITPIASALEGRNVFEVEAELLEQPADLRPGMQGTARIVAGRQPLLWSWSRRLVDGLRLALWGWWG